MPSVRNSLQRQQYRLVESKRNIQGFKIYSECKTEAFEIRLELEFEGRESSHRRLNVGSLRDKY